MSEPNPPNKLEHDEFMALLHRAQGGDKSSLPELRKFFQDPAFVDGFGGDMARRAQHALINKRNSVNLMFREALTRKVDLLWGELAGPNPTPIERLVVDQIVTCWLHLHDLQLTYSEREEITIDIGWYFERSISSAQRRYLGAIKTLAVVRKLAVPVLQANVGNRPLDKAAANGHNGRLQEACPA